MFYLIVRSLAIILFKILFRLEVFGQKNIPLKGGFILASNHISYLDPPALAAACLRALSFLAKEELFTNALFGHFITALNATPLKTESGGIQALRWAVDELKAGKAVLIFPEGGRTADGKLHEPLRGIGFLAVKAAVPIVPAFIEGSNRALPIHAKFIRLKKIRVNFGKAIRAEDVGQQAKTTNLYQAIAARTMEEISRLKNNTRKR